MRTVAGLVAVLGSVLACASPAIDLATGPRQPLESGVELLEDPQGQLDLAAVRALPASRWAAPRSLPLGLGYTQSTFWVRARLHNTHPTEAADRLLQVGSPVQDFVEVAWIGADARVHTHPRSGDREPFANRPIGYAMPTYPLRFQGGETLTVYLRLATYDGLHEPIALTLWQADGFLEAAQSRLLTLGIHYGLTLVLLIYSGSIFVRSRQRVALFYGGYLASIGLWSVTMGGHGLQYLWPEHPTLNNQILPLLMGLAFFFGLQFTTEALELNERLPRMKRLVNIGAWATLLATTPALAGFYAFSFLVSAPLGAAIGLAAVVCGFAWVRHSAQAFWTLAAWIALLSTVSIYLLELLGLRPATPNAADSLILGCTLQVMLLGLGVADAGERLRRDKLSAERSAREAQQALATRLEHQVRDRTQALERANRRLEELAITDALTGAFNRRHFNEQLEAALQRPRWAGESPALCLLDVDNFKAYNDLYGHAKGDKVLVAIAAAMRIGLRRADDQAFRVGGEEFALILQPGDLQMHRDQVEAVRRAIEALRLPHAGTAAGVVTASFGLVQMPVPDRGGRGVSASALYKEADRLLYRAKENGRNRVESAGQPVAQWAASTDFSTEPGAAGA